MRSVKTHKLINERFSGKIIEVSENRAKSILHTNIDMVADETGLIHGGFIFSAADYAAMVAVNDPNVVLGASECRFVAPVRKGESVVFEANVVSTKGKKRIVEVKASVDSKEVFSGRFTTFVLDRHVLE